MSTGDRGNRPRVNWTAPADLITALEEAAQRDRRSPSMELDCALILYLICHHPDLLPKHYMPTAEYLSGRHGPNKDLDPTGFYEEIYDFLKSCNIYPLEIPSIHEVQKHKGGSGLIKRISEAGGLRSVQPFYRLYAHQRLARET
jgi:hypothetical protein